MLSLARALRSLFCFFPLLSILHYLISGAHKRAFLHECLRDFFHPPTCFRPFVADEILFCVKVFFSVVPSSTLWVDNCCVSHGAARCAIV